jgi:hypothetical protein
MMERIAWELYCRNGHLPSCSVGQADIHPDLSITPGCGFGCHAGQHLDDDMRVRVHRTASAPSERLDRQLKVKGFDK